MIEDKLLIRRFKTGDGAALARIYEKYKNTLLKIAAGLLNQGNIAEDIVHDVFVSLAQSSNQLRLDGNLKSYLATCVANRARNINKAGRQKTPDGYNGTKSQIPDNCRPERWIIHNEEMDYMNNALAELPYEQREVVILHVQGGMKFRAIAKSRNVSINTIQSRYHYGLDKLRSLVNSEVEK